MLTTTTTTQETIIIQQHQEQLSTAIGNVFNITSTAKQNTAHSLSQQHQQQTPVGGILSQAETPSDTTSSLSSFTTSTNQQLLSPESIDSVVLTMSPVDSCRTGIIGKTSTFKSHNSNNNNNSNSSNILNNINNNNNINVINKKEMNGSSNKIAIAAPLPNLIGGTESGMRGPRPTPPNTLNLGPLR